MKRPEPSRLEMQVLSVLWKHGPCTVREALDAMPDGKARAYTTILSVMQVMERKGLVSHETRGKAHVYAACVSRSNATGPLLRNLVKHVFGGSAAAVLQQFLAGTSVDPEELKEMKGLIADYERAKAGKSSSRNHKVP
ncbi:MAG: BlaI/MecI/CopY family transcriptional regulator [Verrucomicrobiia bacterium]